MIGTLIGAGLGIAGSIFGGMKASRAAKKAKAYQEQKLRENQQWFDRRYNEDATQRADAQRMLTKTQELLRKRNQQAQGVQSVMGSSEESVANMQSAGNEALAETASRIAAQGEQRRDAVEQQYLQNKNAGLDQLANIEQGRAQATAQATAGVLSAAGGIASAGIGNTNSVLGSTTGVQMPKLSSLDIDSSTGFNTLAKLK